MASRLYCYYGDYRLDPIPLMTLQREFHKTDDTEIIGSEFHLTMNGTIVSYPSGGIVNIDDKQDALINAFSEDGRHFHLFCSGDAGSTTLLTTYPRVHGPTFNESSNNWVFTSPYTIQIDFDDAGVAPEGDPGPFDNSFSLSFDIATAGSGFSGIYIRDAREDWQLEFLEAAPYALELPTEGTDRNPHQLRLSHTISAIGKRHYEASGLVKEAWEQAKSWVILHIGYDQSQVIASGVFNLNQSGLVPFNHTRTQVVDEKGGGFTVTESWIVTSNTGNGIIPNGLEDFTVNIRKGVQSDITNVTIDGQIEGLEIKHYGTNPGQYTIDNTKYEQASGYFAAVEPRLYNRCLLLAGSTPRRTLNINPLTRVVTHSPARGVVAYNFEFDDRPYNLISGAISESITISDDAPVDVFASLIIPGRSAGPVLQDLGTVTSRTRNISIEVITIPYSGGVNNTTDVIALFAATPETAVNTFLGHFVNHMSGIYGQVFLTNDKPTWQPGLGIYNREVSYLLGIC